MGKKSVKIIIYIFLPVFVCICAVLAVMQETRQRKSADECIQTLNEGWYYLDGGEKVSVTLPADIEYRGEGDLTLYHDGISEYASMFFATKGAKYKTEIYIGEKQIYKYEDQGMERNDTVLHNMICAAQLPDTIDGPLAMVFQHTDDGVYEIQQVTVGRWQEQMIHLFAKNVYSLFMDMLLFVLGLLALGFSVVTKKINIDGKKLYYIAGFLLVCSMWGLTDSPFIQFLTGYNRSLIYANFYFFMLIVTPMVRYIKSIGNMGKYRFFSGLICFEYLNIIVQSLLVWSKRLTFFEMLPVTHVIYVFGIIITIILLVREYKKSKDKDLMVCMRAFMAESIIGAVTIILYAFQFPFYQNLFQIGILLFVLILLYSLGIELLESMKYHTEADIYRKLAEEDKLTGLKNRRAFDIMLQSMEHNRETYEDALMIFADLNGLKEVNDNFGHSEGDHQILAAAECIGKAYAGIGYCYRIGGDEFCVVIVNPAGSKKEYERRLKEEVERYNAENERMYSLSIAYGISSLRDESGMEKTISQWKDEADKNMYLNKKSSKAGRR